MTSKGGAAGSASERVLFLCVKVKEANDLSFRVERMVFFLQFVSGKQCEGERRLDRLSSVFCQSRKVGIPDFRCVQVRRES